MKLKTLAHCIAMIGFAAPAFAQEANSLQRVEITGSNIKRIQTEGALPVQIITRQDIERAGITSAEQLVATISANGNGPDTLSTQLGIASGSEQRGNNGNTSANLRGLGASSTLVLLNGRRISPQGMKANSVDLNAIPLAAIQRVEVLKDGASAVYGTDAIGGVINFILRKDYQGAEVTLFTDRTQDGGGNVNRFSTTLGVGSLEKDRYNAMISITTDNQSVLRGSDRPAFVNGYQPARGLATDTTGTPFATQTGAAGTAIGTSYTVPGITTSTGALQPLNRANLLSYQGNCNIVPGMSQYESALWKNPGFARACSYDTAASGILIQPVERTNVVSRANFKLNDETNAFIEFTGSRVKSTKVFEAQQITTSATAATLNPTKPGTFYPVGGPYYQNLKAFIPAFDATKPISYRWRCDLCGTREISTTSDSSRFLAGLDGMVGTWDYKAGISSSTSKANSILGNGYFLTQAFNSVLASGVVNPFLLPGQTQTQAAIDAVEKTKVRGTSLYGGEATLKQLDGAMSGELFKPSWLAGAVTAAVGVDFRRESYRFRSDQAAAPLITGAPFDAGIDKVSRSVSALYAEMIVPVTKQLETSLAVRHDRYSDFGGTTNPRVTFAYRPAETVLLRGSANTGFRAPSFFTLYTASAEQQVPGNIADPVLCAQNPGKLEFCSIRPNYLNGGNPRLQPEKSRQWSLGGAFQPAPWINTNIDFWRVARTGKVVELTPQQLVANYPDFKENFIRDAAGNIQSIRAGWVNADGDITRGVDLGVNLNGKVYGGAVVASLDGTYIDSHKQRIFTKDLYVDNVGQWSSTDLFVRWKHTAKVTYTSGSWSTQVTQQFTSGYKDEVPPGVVPPGFNPDVASYTVYGINATYSGYKNTLITAGIKNVFNRDPSFTAHNYDFLGGAGWDPRVGDPRGRAFTLSVNYKFL